jgi:hypothetical protein
MQELVPGIWHWSAFHPRIRQPVSSYYVEPAGAVIDPMVPEGGLEWFEHRPQPPAQVLLTNRHHYRQSDRFVQAFGCPVRCSRPGLHEFEGGPAVDGFSFGDQPAPGITAVEIDAICPDETALHIAVERGALAFADGLVRPADGPLGFVPDGLMGDDPAAVKAALKDAYRGLLDRDFEHLLFAHGEPLVGAGKSALRDFVTKPVGQPDFGSRA